MKISYVKITAYVLHNVGRCIQCEACLINICNHKVQVRRDEENEG